MKFEAGAIEQARARPFRRTPLDTSSCADRGGGCRQSALKRPSCGTRCSAMSIPASTLMRAMTDGARFERQLGDASEDAVHAHADAQKVGARLEMDVAGSFDGRLGDDALDEADRGCVRRLRP